MQSRGIAIPTCISDEISTILSSGLMPMQKESRTVEQYSGQEFTGIGRGNVVAMDVHPPYWNIPFGTLRP
jgi:hypothetical protein